MVDPAVAFLESINRVVDLEPYRMFVMQSQLLRKVEEPEVEDYAIAALALFLYLSAVPSPTMLRVMRSLAELKPEAYDDAFVAIVDGTYISLPTGELLSISDLKPVEDPGAVDAFVTHVYNLRPLWQRAQKVLSAPPA